MSKIKGITIWEQHLEFLVLGATVVLLLVFSAMQFIGRPNAVEVAQEGVVGPDEVDELLVEEASRINAKLNADAAAPQAISPGEPVSSDFEQRLVEAVSPRDTLPRAFAYVPIGRQETIDPDTIFTEPGVGPPTSIVTRQYFDGLTEEVVQQHEAMKDRFASPPYDISWITTAVNVDEQAILESFRAAGDDGEISPIPESWHSNRVLYAQVIAERQTLVDGEWTNLTVVDAFPGQSSLREDLVNGIETSRRDELLRWLRDPAVQRSITQPEFFPTKNSAWFAPDPDAVNMEGDVPPEIKARYLQRRLVELREGLTETQRELESLRGTQSGRRDDPPSRPPGGAPPGGRPGPPGGGPPGGGPVLGGPGPDDPDGNNNVDRESQRQIRQMESRVRRLESDIRRAEEELQALPEWAHGDAEPTDSEAGTHTVWTHDLDVQPGYTYRYRITVEVYNPLFGRKINLVPEQQALAEQFVLRSPASEWSAPIEVNRPVHVFVARAEPPASSGRQGVIGGPSLGRAVFEVYRFYDGRWWESRFTAGPGERIGGQREEGSRESPVLIDYSTDWFVLDILPEFGEEDTARVVLQNVNSAEVIEVRHPQTDAADPLRRRLREEMQLAARQ